MTNTILKIIGLIVLFIILFIIFDNYLSLAICNLTTLMFELVNNTKRILYGLFPVTTRVLFGGISVMLIRWIYNLIISKIVDREKNSTDINVGL